MCSSDLTEKKVGINVSVTDNALGGAAANVSRDYELTIVEVSGDILGVYLDVTNYAFDAEHPDNQGLGYVNPVQARWNAELNRFEAGVPKLKSRAAVRMITTAEGKLGRIGTNDWAEPDAGTSKQFTNFVILPPQQYVDTKLYIKDPGGISKSFDLRIFKLGNDASLEALQTESELALSPGFEKTVYNYKLDVKDKNSVTFPLIKATDPFETASEIKMFQKLGGDVVGMTGVPEVCLANELGICYSSISLDRKSVV